MVDKKLRTRFTIAFDSFVRLLCLQCQPINWQVVSFSLTSGLYVVAFTMRFARTSSKLLSRSRIDRFTIEKRVERDQRNTMISKMIFFSFHFVLLSALPSRVIAQQVSRWQHQFCQLRVWHRARDCFPFALWSPFWHFTAIFWHDTFRAFFSFSFRYKMVRKHTSALE